jgi:UPF0755 protein
MTEEKNIAPDAAENTNPAKGKLILSILAVVVAVGFYVFYGYYAKNYRANVPTKLAQRYVYIPNNTSFDSLVTILQTNGQLIDAPSFREVAADEEYNKLRVRPGRFEIKPSMGNKTLVRLLKVGKQSPVKVSFNNKRLMEDVAGYLGKVLQPDSAAFMAVFNDADYLKTVGYTPQTVMTAFISNTYELFWTNEPKDVLARMIKEHDRFWNEDRLAKAKKLGLTPTEVYTLASIVEKETLASKEKSRVAGVYLNRLHQGWKLEADPTVVYACRQWDLRRILLTHLATDSPYNTYMYMGLPPGPIYLPQFTTLDATLDAESHRYMFFCAAPDNSGTHVFAETLAQHNANAALYHKWLNEQGRLPNVKK